VTDTGIGISAENLYTIFGAFEQGDGTTSRSYGGTGLGLAICREVASHLGGRITAESQLGAGSTFTLLLPSYPAAPLASGEVEEGQPGTAAERPGAQAATAEAAAAESAPAEIPPAEAAAARAAPSPNGSRRVPASGPHHALQGRRVLIVDDDVRNVFAITSILELYGISVVHAPDGRKGIGSLLAGDDIDLVLMDVMMPEMDGYATMAAIRQLPQFAALPVIAVTARAMPEDRAKSLASGATDYITKPVDTEELLSCMERCLAG
jgi:CheY-like chemotaxis protein